MDLFRAGSRLARLEAEGELNAAIETAMQAMKTHKATSARLSTQDGEIVWRGYPDPNDRPF
ncbi:MAG: hypothetical protein ABWZ40_09595 [Caulobacterales bacterium]